MSDEARFDPHEHSVFVMLQRGDVLDHGRKDDSSKPMVGLMLADFAFALEEVARLTTFGAKRYAPGNWLHVKDGQKRYTDAMSRHLLQDLSGEVYDQESGLHHATAVAWNALARLELTLRELKRVRSE